MKTHPIARLIVVVAAIAVAGSFDARAQGTLTSNDLIDGLKGLEQTPNIDVAAMRARAAVRAKANADKNPVNREPIADQLFKLPQLTLEIQFNLDSNIIRHESYPALGRIADALYHPYLLEYRVLVVGHTDAT
ncbi:MAG TPA: OmpA family protein, partial [Pseudorhodoplanes sp.]|nr:OmpA family protein [Pseudorhodoplanes sp.]